MKKFMLILAVAFVCISCATEEPFEVKRGVNISHWLSQSTLKDREDSLTS